MAMYNMAPQDLLPLPVQQIAADQQLGAFAKAYPPSLTRTILGALLFLITGGLFFAGGVFPPDSVNTKVILAGFGVALLGLALYLFSTVAQAATQRVYLFQRGVVIAKGDQLQPFPWNQVAEVWQSVTRNYRNGIYVGTTYSYTLHRVDGYQIKLGNLTKNIAELGPVIARGVTQELIPRALHAIRNGQTLTFALFSVNQQGIGNGREFIPWQQVQNINVKQGRVTVKKIGISRTWGTITVAKMPNFLIFTAVTEEMIRQSGGGRG